jgi:hypothetical protein
MSEKLFGNQPVTAEDAGFAIHFVILKVSVFILESVSAIWV